MRVLVTGAAGFIGSHLCERLVGRGFSVVGLDNFDDFYEPALKRENVRGLLVSPGFELVEGDIRDAALVERMVARGNFDAVIHLAARAGVRPSLEKPVLYTDVNVRGTVELLECARRHEVPRFIFASSSSVYGERAGAPFREDDSVDFPISPYAATKKGGELLAYTYHHLYGLDIACLRFFTVYGPRQRPEMAIHKFTRAIDRGESITMFGDGTMRRDFTYVDDVIAGVIAALERANGYRIYNLGNNRTVELRELIHIIEEAVGKKARIERLPLQPGDVPLTCADIDRARQELGYQPATPIEEGVRLFLQWYRRRKKSS